MSIITVKSYSVFKPNRRFQSYFRIIESNICAPVLLYVFNLLQKGDKMLNKASFYRFSPTHKFNKTWALMFEKNPLYNCHPIYMILCHLDSTLIWSHWLITIHFYWSVSYIDQCMSRWDIIIIIGFWPLC